jgi:hypothetical protein
LISFSAILAEDDPIGHRDELVDMLGQLHHDLPGVVGAVGQFPLFVGRLVHLRVVVAEHHRPVGAQVVDVLVAVHIVDPRSLGVIDEQRIGLVALVDRPGLAGHPTRHQT